MSRWKGKKKRSLWILNISVNIHKAKYLKFFIWILLSIKLFLSYRIGLFSAGTIPNTHIVVDVVVVQSLSHVQLFATKWTVTRQAPLSFTTSWNLLKFTSIVLVMLLLDGYISSSASRLSFNPSQHQGLFQCIDSSHQGAKIQELQLKEWSFQWIFRIDFL